MTDPARALHHIGVTVASIPDALGFWAAFLGLKPRFQGRLDRPYLGSSVGHPGVVMEAALLDLPGGTLLELLDYGAHRRDALPDDSAHVGNVHLCLAVDDIERAWAAARSAGARKVSVDGPVTVDAGPNMGARAVYLRIHDGITLELFQPPASSASAVAGPSAPAQC